MQENDEFPSYFKRRDDDPEWYTPFLNALHPKRKEHYESWRNVGMALKAKYGVTPYDNAIIGDPDIEKRAYRVFDEWSKGAKNYNQEKNKKMWDSFKTAIQLYEAGRQKAHTVKTIMWMWREDQFYGS